MTRFVLFLFCLVTAASAAFAKPTVTAARIGQHPGKTRFVMELTEAPAYQIFTLPDPFRVVVDLPELDWRLPAQQVPRKSGLVKDLRFGKFSAGTSRVVLDLRKPVRVRNVHVLPPRGTVVTYRLVIDLEAISRQAFLSADRQPINSAIPLPPARAAGLPELPPKPEADKRPTVVIDAGHGGVDPGAVGLSGALEKDLVLIYARELRRQLQASGRYRVVMTRNADIVLPLRSRVELAQQAEGDLFVSLHANIHRNPRVKGASVYTLSEKGASDAEAKALADKENQADVLVGVNLGVQTPEVSQILMDLTQRETMNLSKNFANIMVRELGQKVRLLKNTHRFAGFAVLKSITVPSVLIEIGYMSNKAEERQLRSKPHRKKVSAGIVKAIDRYFRWQEKLSRS